jgi:hypothetical protein
MKTCASSHFLRFLLITLFFSFSGIAEASLWGLGRAAAAASRASRAGRIVTKVPKPRALVAPKKVPKIKATTPSTPKKKWITYDATRADGKKYIGRASGPSGWSNEKILKTRWSNHHAKKQGFSWNDAKVTSSTSSRAVNRGLEHRALNKWSNSGKLVNQRAGISAKNLATDKGKSYMSASKQWLSRNKGKVAKSSFSW